MWLEALEKLDVVFSGMVLLCTMALGYKQYLVIIYQHTSVINEFEAMFELDTLTSDNN